mgnify:CR=1 FL=1
MFRRRLREIRIRRPEAKSGSSLIIVVCVSAFLVAFALAIVYTGSMLMARANRRLEQERCYQLARSFAQVLDGELAHCSGQELSQVPANSFYRFSCRFLESADYPEYSPEHPDLTTFYYRPETAGAGEDYGKITVMLYKENDQITDDLTGTLPSNPADFGGSGSSSNPVDTVAKDIFRFTCHVEVEAELRGVTYRCITSYETRASYREDAVEFTAGGTRIRWDDDAKKWLDNNGTVHEVPSGTPIIYQINPGYSRLISCTFTKTIPEGTDPGEQGGEQP